ncbi:MAG: hypothetical protein ACE5HI_09860 [bacterium]
MMNDKKFKQSDYMSLQLMEIESFRMSLSQQSQEHISFHEAVMLWIAQGYAEEFKAEYFIKRDKIEPAIA